MTSTSFQCWWNRLKKLTKLQMVFCTSVPTMWGADWFENNFHDQLISSHIEFPTWHSEMGLFKRVEIWSLITRSPTASTNTKSQSLTTWKRRTTRWNWFISMSPTIMRTILNPTFNKKIVCLHLTSGHLPFLSQSFFRQSLFPGARLNYNFISNNQVS